MRARTRRLLASLPLLVHAAIADRATAQGVEGDLSGLALENAELFVQPLTQGLGFAMTSGLFDEAKPLGRFGFDVGIRVNAALPPTEAETFSAVLPASVVWNRPVLGPRTYSNPFKGKGASLLSPTAVGDGPGVILEPTGQFRSDLVLYGQNPANYEIAFPEGLKIPAIPFLVAHASVGLGFGTDVTVRFIPEIEVDDELGAIKAMGFAVRHEISTWIPMPLDLSVVLGTQTLNVGDYLEASSTQYGLVAGRGLGPLSLFVSGIARSASVNISYTVENPDDNPGLPEDGTEIRFEEDIESGVALGAGARLSLLFMNIDGQYVMDDYNGFSVKMGFGLGRR
ncbi:MAG: hypothetical protein EXR92_07235 [Gemmatimonadetes bacterium]|nr:hypothetical protein [Gemmatimonadota bacterium]